jgi:hypothetical protein
MSKKLVLTILFLTVLLSIISNPVEGQEEWTYKDSDEELNEDGGEEFNDEFHDVDSDNTDSGGIINNNNLPTLINISV